MSEILILHKISETATTITLGWVPPPGAIGYVFYRDGARVSNTWDGTKASIKIEKAAKIEVEAVGSLAKGVWPMPAPPATEDFTWTPPNPKVNEPVTFTVINPHAGFTYGWDRTDDKVPEFTGTSYVYGYQGAGQKKMNLMRDGVVVRSYTFDVTPAVVTPPDPPPTPGAVLKPTYSFVITKGFYDANDGPSPNYQAGWAGKQNGTYTIDRLANDSFCGVMMLEIEAAWNDALQGEWGRMWNLHNTSLEKDQAGWATAPGNSAVAMDYIGGNLTVNADDNPTKNYTIKAGLQKAKRHTIATKMVLGRNDGSTARPGRIRFWLNGELMVDKNNINTVWKFSNGVIQRWMWVWAGFYSRNVQAPLPFKLSFPFMGTTPGGAMAQKVGGEGGAWALSTIPIPGADHSQGPATCVQIPSWSSDDAVLPADWLTAA
jgi:hypothetical protein